MATEKQLQDYRDQGYFIADDAVDAAMLEALEAAARRVREKVRSGAVDIKSSRSESGEPQVIWGLMAPEFAEPVFAAYLISKPLMAYVRAMLGEELRLGAVSIFCNANQAPYDTGWHRDLGGEERDSSAAVELEILGRFRKYHRKWHLALADDPCLWLVPGSHRRYRTEREREAMIDNPYADIPGQRRISLQRGQTLFWSGNGIHRGRAPEELDERLSLVAHLDQYREGEPRMEKDDRFAWLLAENVRGALPEQLQLYYDRWRALQQV